MVHLQIGWKLQPLRVPALVHVGLSEFLRSIRVHRYERIAIITVEGLASVFIRYAALTGEPNHSYFIAAAGFSLDRAHSCGCASGRTLRSGIGEWGSIRGKSACTWPKFPIRWAGPELIDIVQRSIRVFQLRPVEWPHIGDGGGFASQTFARAYRISIVFANGAARMDIGFIYLLFFNRNTTIAAVGMFKVH